MCVDTANCGGWCYECQLDKRRKYRDQGSWRAFQNSPPDSRVCLESDDFTHDVVLYISGDFKDDKAKLRYAMALADMLNEVRAVTKE